MKKLSVIIPAFNEQRNIKKVIRLVKKNENVDEIIVVDNNSTDLTGIYAKKEEADNVLDSLSKSNYQAQLFEIKYAKLSLVIKGLEKQDNAFIKNLFLSLDKKKKYMSQKPQASGIYWKFIHDFPLIWDVQFSSYLLNWPLSLDKLT